MTYYIGLDAHSKTSTFSILDSKGREVDKAHVETTEKNLISVIRSVKGPKKLVFEEMHLSQWLYVTLKDEVDELIVCNPYYLGKKRHSKTDLHDARHLASELRCGHITPVHHDSGHLMKMRSLISAYTQLNRDCVSLKNRYKAIFRSQGIGVKSGPKFYKEQEWINKLKTEEDRFIAQSLFDQIQVCEEHKTKFKNYFLELKKSDPTVKFLTSVPGIDAIRAVTIASLICSPHHFLNKHKLWSYSMLVRHTKISDGKAYGTQICYGRVELKQVFMGAAETNLKTKNSLKKYYDQFCSKGLDRGKAKKAVARRIAAICLQIMKKGVKYDDRYLEKIKL